MTKYEWAKCLNPGSMIHIAYGGYVDGEGLSEVRMDNRQLAMLAIACGRSALSMPSSLPRRQLLNFVNSVEGSLISVDDANSLDQIIVGHELDRLMEHLYVWQAEEAVGHCQFENMLIGICHDLATLGSNYSPVFDRVAFEAADRVISYSLNALRRDVVDTKSTQGFRQVAGMVRDIVGPYHPIYCEPPPWTNDPSVQSVAAGCYSETISTGVIDPQRLAILADAAQDAGCDDWCILEHLRGREECTDCFFSEGEFAGGGSWWCPTCGGTSDHPKGEGMMRLRSPHYRGCWALDIAMGRICHPNPVVMPESPPYAEMQPAIWPSN